MAEKATCPACDSHLSSIYRAFQDGAPCPSCGLPAEVAAEVAAARGRHLDDERTEQLAAAIAARGRAEAERDDLRRELLQLARKVTQLGQEVERATRPLAVKVREQDGW